MTCFIRFLILMNLLITGGAGFIGSAFVKLAVENGIKTSVVDTLTYAGDFKRIANVADKIDFYNADISEKAAMEQIFSLVNPEYIVHWAAESHVDKSIHDATPFMKTNVIGTQILLDLSRKYKIKKFVNIATDEVYGELGEEGSFYEDTPLAPNSPYSVSKTSQDMLGRAYYRTFELPVVTCRPSNNYGPWQYPEKLFPVVMLKALNNEKIPVYGNGKNVREWLFVEDCAKAVMTVLQKAEPGSIYNIGSGNERQNIEVIKYILNKLGKSEDLIEFVTDRPGHDFRYSLNFDKIKNELGWEPLINFEDGFDLTIDWYLQNRNWMEEKLLELRKFWEIVYKK